MSLPGSVHLDPGWTLSFAGCGFRSVYYVGAVCCLLQRAPGLVTGATRFSGASSGCLVAAALAVGIPLSDLCCELMSIAVEARSLSLSVLHPSFNLLRCARRLLVERLPQDAHVRSSGRLWVSLTRVCDGSNTLVSHYRSREELIQVLLCSCFFPVYCGFIPPTFRGQWYMDGALSDNQPLCDLKNTLTFAPFSGESDLCPQDVTFDPVQVYYGNLSIRVNIANIQRIWSSFMPSDTQMLSEVCVTGYRDALRFITRSGFVETQNFSENEKDVTEILPEEIRRVLSAARSSPGPKPGFSRVSDAPLVCVVLGLVLDLVLVLIRLVFLPIGLILNLFIRVLSLLSRRRPLHRDKWLRVDLDDVINDCNLQKNKP